MRKNIEPRLPYWVIILVELGKGLTFSKKLVFSELMKEGKRISPEFRKRKINI